MQGAVVFVDFTKVLIFFGMGLYVVNFNTFWIQCIIYEMGKTLYSNIQTCVIDNGWISETFANIRGIRQGCPLSALLFVLSVDIMIIRLRSNTDIHGLNIKVEDKTHT